MRIIAGKYKGRKLSGKVGKATRPTKTKVREAIFSMLSSGHFLVDGVSKLQDAVVLELFSGTASLSLESLSRGAKKVILVDQDIRTLDTAREILKSLGELDNAILIRGDATNLPSAKIQADLVFIDPPYKSGFGNKSLKSLVRNNWLHQDSIIILETSRTEDLILPKELTVIDTRIYGISKVSIIAMENHGGTKE